MKNRNIGGIVGSFSNEGEQTEKVINGNTVDLTNSEAKFNIVNAGETSGIPLPVGGIIGQIGGGTMGKVSGNTLKISNIDQIADGKGCVITGYSQEFYGYSGNQGICGEKSWKNNNTYDTPIVSEAFK